MKTDRAARGNTYTLGSTPHPSRSGPAHVETPHLRSTPPTSPSGVIPYSRGRLEVPNDAASWPTRLAHILGRATSTAVAAVMIAAGASSLPPKAVATELEAAVLQPSSSLSLGGAPGQVWRGQRTIDGLELRVDAPAGPNPERIVRNARLELPADFYFEPGSVFAPRRMSAQRVVFSLAVPPGTSPEGTAQLIADFINTDPATRLLAEVDGAQVRLRSPASGSRESLGLEQRLGRNTESARRRLARAEAESSGWSARSSPPPPPNTIAVAGALDRPAEQALALLTRLSANFSKPAHEVFLALEHELGGTLERVNMVGRSLGSGGLRIPTWHEKGNALHFDPGVVRRLASFELRRGAGVAGPLATRVYLGFVPALDAKGHATQFGTYELLVPRERPRPPGPNSERFEYTDFATIESKPAELAPRQARVNDPGCTVCHDSGVPIWSHKGPYTGTQHEGESSRDPFYQRLMNGEVLPVRSRGYDAPLSDTRSLGAAIIEDALEINGKRWVRKLGAENREIKRDLVELIFRPEKRTGFEQKHRSAIEAAQQNFREGNNGLLDVHPQDQNRDTLMAQPFYNPALPRPNGTSRNPFANQYSLLEHGLNALWGLGEYAPAQSSLGDDIKAIVGANRVDEFLASRELASSLAVSWPPLPEQLIEAARGFASGSAPARLSRTHD